MAKRSPSILFYFKLFKSHVGAKIYIVFLLTFVAALSEGLGIVMLLPLLETLSDSDVPPADAADVSDGSVSGIQALIGRFFSVINPSGSVAVVLIIITVAFLMKGSLTFAALAVNARLRGGYLRRLRQRLFDSYTRMSYSYYSRKDTGHFVNLVNEQSNRAMQSFYSFSYLGAHLTTAVVYLGLAFTVAWRFGFMAVVAGTVLFALFRWLNGYVLRLSRKTVIENSLLSKLLIQALHAFKYLVATRQMPKVRGHVEVSINRLVGYEVRRSTAEALTGSAREPVAAVFVMAIVMIQVVILEQPLSPILISILLFYRGVNLLLAVQASWQSTLDHVGSLEAIDEELLRQRKHEEQSGRDHIGEFNESIRFDNVSFRYDAGDVWAISDLTLDIPCNSSVALVGMSGAGKSTLVDLVTLILKPERGTIVIDGVPSSRIELTRWRRQIGYVSQDFVVFDDTVENNICLWEEHPDGPDVQHAEVVVAAQKAHLHDFIESLPDGYNTVVGERGLRMSGGQRQRLCIARELYRKPRVLILDEATSALDSESERAIQDSIDDLQGQVTLIAIAHRLSTIRNAHKIFVLDGGRLIESGTYEPLRDSAGSTFGKLVEMQAL